MRLVCFVALALLGLASATSFSYQSDFEADLEYSSFMKYITNFEKKYASMDELIQRFANFKDNLANIAKLNSDGRNVYGLTKFSDMSKAEFKGKYLGFNPKLHKHLPRAPLAGHRLHHRIASVNASDVDWRTKGAVTPVKDQQQCGSCWAFSATEEIESMWHLAGNDLIELSPQQIVSCDTTDGGCNGGWTTSAYQYVQTQGGIELDSDYPYTSGGGDSGTCSVDTSKLAAKISGFEYATPPCQDSCTTQDEATLLKNLAATGPVSICVDAESWQSYVSGVITDNCPSDFSDIDHCVQLVGYHASGDYWIIRNSWNTNWGDQGYIYVKKGSNLCGLADLATIVTI